MADGQVQRGEHDAVAGQPRPQLAAVPQHPDQPHRPEQVLDGERGPDDDLGDAVLVGKSPKGRKPGPRRIGPASNAGP